MITQISGRLIEKTPTYVVIECNGIGYMINISLQTFSLINDEACKLYTHLSVKEDSHTLYGFFNQNERHLFRNLISVSGVDLVLLKLYYQLTVPKKSFLLYHLQMLLPYSTLKESVQKLLKEL